MFRATLLLAMLFCISLPSLSAGPPRRDTSILDAGSEEDRFAEEEALVESESLRMDDFGPVGSILFALKNQFKEILEEIGLQLFSYMVKMLQHFKVKLLKKLGMYTLSDVFHTVFDGVTDFVVESPPNDFYDTKELLTVNPPYAYAYPYGSSSFQPGV